jgi:DNA-binding NtrC family response regulator
MATRVLLLDDDVELLQALQEALEAHDFSIQTSRSVQSATLLIEQHPFDVVVTDLALEGTGGLAFCERLARERPTLPIVVLSGHGEARTAALRLGAREVLLKPVSSDALVAALRRVTAGA